MEGLYITKKGIQFTFLEIFNKKHIFNLLIAVIDLSIRTQDLLDTQPEYKEI